MDKSTKHDLYSGSKQSILQVVLTIFDINTIDMKNFTYRLVVGFLGLFIISACSGETTNEKEEKAACTYSFDQSASTLEWTAYKFTDKTPVKGSFNEIQFDGLNSAENTKDLIQSLSFTIETSSVETQNEERNGKIVKLFFGTIGTAQITGKVKSLGADGKATVSIAMNNITKDVKGEYTLDGEQFSFTSSIDVLDWSAAKGIEELNTACKDLHKGKDGVSKLWSEVGLSFTTTVVKSCK